MVLTSAEKQAAYRERQRLAREVDPELEKLADALETIDAALSEDEPTPPAPTRRTLPISEDAYVRLMLAEPAILDYKRAERYARWRYRGVLAGRVSAL
jgi:hypothetical protein